MKKNIIIFIFILFLCIGAIGGIYCYNKLNKTTYCLNLPVIDNVSNIILEQNAKGVAISDFGKMKDIIDVLNEVKRVTKKASTQDMPINVDDEIKIDFKLKKGETATVFVYKNNNKYYIEQPYNGIYRISADEYNSIEKYIKTSNDGMTTEPYIPDGMDVSDENNTEIQVKEKEYNRSPENVTIEVLKDTTTNETVEILITDNNEDYYAWGEEFRIQKKENGNWQGVPTITDEMTFAAIAWIPNKDNQLKMKINYGKYYGELENGIYRIVKTIYDGKYIEIYSNEFEVK